MVGAALYGGFAPPTPKHPTASILLNLTDTTKENEGRFGQAANNGDTSELRGPHSRGLDSASPGADCRNSARIVTLSPWQS
jgi:hypothetical protein